MPLCGHTTAFNTRMRQMKIQNKICENLERYPHIEEAFGEAIKERISLADYLQNSLIRGIYLRRESIKEIDEFIKEILEAQQFDIKSLTAEFSTKDANFD